MSSFFNKLPDVIQSEIYEFMYDRPLKTRVMKQLLLCTKCIACANYLTPKFCKNGANFCSLSCYNDQSNDEFMIDEYMEELENGGSDRYGP